MMSFFMHEVAGSGRDDQRAFVVKLLADRANVNAADGLGSVPLLDASRCGYSEVVQLLLDAGARVDAATANGQTPLCAAAFKGHSQVVQQLLAAGAKVDAVATDGCWQQGPRWMQQQQTPLHAPVFGAADTFGRTLSCHRSRQGWEDHAAESSQGRAARGAAAAAGSGCQCQCSKLTWTDPLVCSSWCWSA
jgi:ankyrin repeat protein